MNTVPSSHQRQAERSVVRRPDGRLWIALRKQLDWPPRRRTSPAPGSPPRVPAGSYVVTLDFAEVGGRLECVRFEIGADVDEANGPDPAPLTASVLRGVPLRELIDQTLFEQTREHYGEIWYDLGGKKVMSRLTTTGDLGSEVSTPQTEKDSGTFGSPSPGTFRPSISTPSRASSLG